MQDQQSRRMTGDSEALRSPNRERRAYLRRAGRGLTAVLLRPGGGRESGRWVFLERVLARFGLTRRPAANRPAEQAPGSRRAHLRSIASRLETILGELDELGLQRTAIDVCMAVDRIKGHLADCNLDDGSWESRPATGLAGARSGSNR